MIKNKSSKSKALENLLDQPESPSPHGLTIIIGSMRPMHDKESGFEKMLKAKKRRGDRHPE